MFEYGRIRDNIELTSSLAAASDAHNNGVDSGEVLKQLSSLMGEEHDGKSHVVQSRNSFQSWLVIVK